MGEAKKYVTSEALGSHVHADNACHSDSSHLPSPCTKLFYNRGMDC